MKLSLVALGFAGAAAIAYGTHWSVDRLRREAREGTTTADAEHLVGQEVEAAMLRLELFADPLELRGTLRATVRCESPFRLLHAVAPADLEIDTVGIASSSAQESGTWSEGLIATPRSHRRYQSDERTRDREAPVEVRFRRAVVGPGLEPLPCVCDPVTLVELAADGEIAELEVVLPEGTGLVTDDASGALVELGPGRHALGARGRGRAPLLFGSLRTREIATANGTFRVIAPESLLPAPALQNKAVETLARAVPAGRREAPQRTVLLREGIPEGVVQSIGGGWIATAPPRDSNDLAHSLLAALLHADRVGNPQSDLQGDAHDPLMGFLLDSLPATLLAQALAPERPRLLEQASAMPGIRAWRVLEAAFGDRARETARELASGVARPALLDDPVARAFLDWSLAGVEASLERWRADLVRGVTVASGEVVLRPPPPSGRTLMVTVGFVGRERMQVARFQVGGERTSFDSVELQERPLVVAIDPEGALPHRGDPEGAPHHRPLGPRDDSRVVALDVAPYAFAVSQDASALAVALARGGAAPVSGVSVLRAGPEDEIEVARWIATERPLRSVEWAMAGRYLALDELGRKPRLVDVIDGSVLPFDGVLTVAPRRAFLVESSERAPGCFSHTLHDLSAGLSWPIPIARHGVARWIPGSDELLAAAPDGRVAVLDRRGRQRFGIQLLLGSVRELRREPFGYVVAYDTSQGTKVALLDPQGQPLRAVPVVGRMEGLNYSSDTGALLAFTSVGREHVVTRIDVEGGGGGSILFRGRSRPLPSAPCKRGLVLVDAESDALPAGEPRRLRFATFDLLARGEPPTGETGNGNGGPAGSENEAGPRLVSAEALVEPPPVSASAGRYLYYLRAHGGPRGLPGRLRPRALYRYDFLSGREEPLAIASR